MSEPHGDLYKLDQAEAAKGQVRAIGAYAKTIGKTREFGRILRKGMQLLQTDPHGWGDPVHRAKRIEAVACRGLIRPVVFHYVIYEQVRTVMLLSVRLYADFD